MSPRRPTARANSSSVLRGVLLLARGQADGLTQFGSSPQAFLASLAPLVAFPLVGALLLLSQGAARSALAEFLATLCALLAPPVLAFEPARWWRRREHWLRYATALNWCQWAIPVVAMLLLVLVFPLAQALIAPRIAAIGLILLLAAYAFWLHWFVARHGLAISALRAALLVLIVNGLTVALVVGPQILAGTLRLGPA